ACSRTRFPSHGRRHKGSIRRALADTGGSPALTNLMSGGSRFEGEARSMDLLTTDTRSDRVARADAPLATAPKGTRRRSTPTQAGTPDSAAPDTSPDPRRMTLARASVRLLSTTI